MVARIAPSPITASVAIGDGLSHAPTPSVFNGGGNRQNQQSFAQSETAIQVAASNVPPPPPPGEAFAAAVIAGQLPPRPISPEQLKQRLGSAWQPPASPLRLMDRSA